MTPKYPNVEVRLVGEDGNIFSIMGRVRKEMKKQKVSIEEINQFMDDVRNSDSYDEALRVVMKYVVVS